MLCGRRWNFLARALSSTGLWSDLAVYAWNPATAGPCACKPRDAPCADNCCAGLQCAAPAPGGPRVCVDKPAPPAIASAEPVAAEDGTLASIAVQLQPGADAGAANATFTTLELRATAEGTEPIELSVPAVRLCWWCWCLTARQNLLLPCAATACCVPRPPLSVPAALPHCTPPAAGCHLPVAGARRPGPVRPAVDPHRPRAELHGALVGAGAADLQGARLLPAPWRSGVGSPPLLLAPPGGLHLLGRVRAGRAVLRHAAVRALPPNSSASPLTERLPVSRLPAPAPGAPPSTLRPRQPRPA